MKLFSRLLMMACVFTALPAFAANQADLHVAVYASGLLVDTQRQVTYGDKSRHVSIKTLTHGTAKGEAPDSMIDIERLDQGLQWHLDPRTKTYTEERFMDSFKGGQGSLSPQSPSPTLKISKIDPKVTGPLGSAMINGFPCQSYTIRIVADFSDPKTGKVVATETLLEKLWVTEKAPEIVSFRTTDEAFRKSLSDTYGTEKANFRWLIRHLNKTILELNGNPEDFKALQMTYQGARASIKGVTVRQLAGWNWRVKDASAPGAGAIDDINTFVGAIAAGLGAPPDQEGKKPLSDAEKPKWVLELEKDLGRVGPTALILEEVLKVKTAKVTPDFFEVPTDYRKN